MTVGERVRQARELRGLGNNELDRKLGRSQGRRPTPSERSNMWKAIEQAGGRWLEETRWTLTSMRWSSDVDPSVRRWTQVGDQIDASYRLGLEEPGEPDDEPDEILPTRGES